MDGTSGDAGASAPSTQHSFVVCTFLGGDHALAGFGGEVAGVKGRLQLAAPLVP